MRCSLQMRPAQDETRAGATCTWNAADGYSGMRKEYRSESPAMASNRRRGSPGAATRSDRGDWPPENVAVICYPPATAVYGVSESYIEHGQIDAHSRFRLKPRRAVESCAANAVPG